jgi:hypothetical protein
MTPFNKKLTITSLLSSNSNGTNRANCTNTATRAARVSSDIEWSGYVVVLRDEGVMGWGKEETIVYTRGKKKDDAEMRSYVSKSERKQGKEEER